ncbi:MAG: methyltransferase domain-containing protein [Gammaproteobacteria bacterium]|jgi:predicted nicotinamide N-methyase|nr:methyltransferase domain-containing protein [Gammaproteobacteria bacterium]MBU1491215.1 methyltransferase domain-containing protein [Gammaproteobacteria bacterium]MBU2140233.1 methyltransferase domain-containing protein [Gammaproteobacteria bacterium]MBU2217212.1 methyltransferase domain-containing protein [Gammaproteobacteria bacterium]MBU2323443.1 methyltransferase domain-containing protein [Gammaproteobacteria bacterium]
MPGYRIKYSTLSIGLEDFHLCSLRDKQQYADAQGAAERAGISSATWSLFGQLWPAGEVLAQTLSSMPVAGLRILELGCGLGLTSLLLQRHGADITASDYHPLAAEFLLRNAALNELSPIPYRQCDWAETDGTLGVFDLIIGSDLLYERSHPALLAGFIARHGADGCRVLIVDPARGNAARFSRLMAEQGYRQLADRINLLADPLLPFRGRILKYQRGVA